MGFIDWEKHHKNIADRIVKMLNLDTDPVYEGKFRKFCNWWLYKLPPIFTTITGFIVMIWFFRRINERYDIENVFIVVSVIIIFTLRGINKQVTLLNEKFNQK